MKSVLNMFKVKDEDAQYGVAGNNQASYSAAISQNQNNYVEEDFLDDDDFEGIASDSLALRNDLENDLEKDLENDWEEELEDDFFDDEDDFESDSDVFQEFTDKVQSLLDDGAIALEIAEEKTAQLENMDANSSNYRLLIEEIKIAQANARQNFDDAEFLIKKANEILEENK